MSTIDKMKSVGRKVTLGDTLWLPRRTYNIYTNNGHVRTKYMNAEIIFLLYGEASVYID